jgi:hypothetical protein
VAVLAPKKPRKQSYGLSDYYLPKNNHYGKMIDKLSKRLEGRRILLSLNSMIAKLDGAKEQWNVGMMCRAWDDNGEAVVECVAQ